MKKVSKTTVCLPRMRGDPPYATEIPGHVNPSTPHARGSTALVLALLPCKNVYPACAGIHPPTVQRLVLYRSLPRMRGDPPGFFAVVLRASGSTPHARGSTRLAVFLVASPGVYPACAGIHPFERASRASLGGLPRMRGDPPLYPFSYIHHRSSTPHARGSTLHQLQPLTSYNVYPACAGIHPPCL